MSREENNLKRKKLINLLVAARIEQCKKDNLKKYGNNDFLRENEKPSTWLHFYSTYPMKSKKYPQFSLEGEYRRFYNKEVNI